MSTEANIVELQIARLAREIARQKSPTSVLTVASSPHEIARALYLTGWRPPVDTLVGLGYLLGPREGTQNAND